MVDAVMCLHFVKNSFTPCCSNMKHNVSCSIFFKKRLLFLQLEYNYVQVTNLIVLTFRVKLSFTVSFLLLKNCLYFHTLKSLYTFSDFTEQIKACFPITVHRFYSSFSHSIIPVGFFSCALQWLM